MAVYAADLLWGCPQMSYKAKSPINGMRQDFAAFKKETCMDPWILDRRIYLGFLRSYKFFLLTI
jgi:hypothetical protein